MGLAPYGKPIDSLLNILQVKKGSKIKIDWDRLFSLVRTTKFEVGDPSKDTRKDYASSAQFLLESCALELMSELKQVSGLSSICLAGGTALNIDMNGKLLSSGMVKDMFVQPAAHDAGTALGAALIIHQQYSSKKPKKMEHAFFGPNYDSEFEKFLKDKNIQFEKIDDVADEISELLSNDKTIGWMQGNAEVGPRALGARSILANPENLEMWAKVNKIKGREYWRPLAPSIMEEKTKDYFENFNSLSPFMLLSFNVKKERVDKIPAVVHVDNTARPQTVSKKSNKLYWELLKKFEEKKGIPILLNTSFNVRGEPMVNTPNDALNSFMKMNLDYLCLGDYLIKK